MSFSIKYSRFMYHANFGLNWDVTNPFFMYDLGGINETGNWI